jgi:hypothetical protein
VDRAIGVVNEPAELADHSLGSFLGVVGVLELDVVDDSNLATGKVAAVLPSINAWDIDIGEIEVAVLAWGSSNALRVLPKAELSGLTFRPTWLSSSRQIGLGLEMFGEGFCLELRSVEAVEIGALSSCGR